MFPDKYYIINVNIGEIWQDTISSRRAQQGEMYTVYMYETKECMGFNLLIIAYKFPCGAPNMTQFM